MTKAESIDAVRESYSLNHEKIRNESQGKNGNAGITLVALVVTIVVLLILAGITLVYVFGDNGIFKLAQDAKEKTEQGMQKEQDEIGNLVNMLKEEYGNNVGSGESGGGTTNPPDEPDPPVKSKNISEIVGEKQDATITVEDANKNKITIPAGFKIVPNGGTDDASKVEYSYNGDGTPAVQDGIVIEDATGTETNGNQFVWVPVGTINNKKGDTTHGTTSTITLGRYNDFAVKTDEEGNKYYQPKQTAAQYKKPEGSTQTDLQYQDAYKIDSYYIELTEKLEGKNEIAESLESFLASATTKGGYYLARYEASEGESNKPMSKANQTVWNKVTQPNVATYARGMYGVDDPMKSDLVNSYAWDTAIIFIQTYSEDNSNYANQKSRKSGSSPFATGTSGDSACNIHDMASNCYEWSTEYSTDTVGITSNPCVYRGGVYSTSLYTASTRGLSTTTSSFTFSSFRPLCYVKLN